MTTWRGDFNWPICVAMLAPPYTATVRMPFLCWANFSSCSAICWPNSRVGASTKACTWSHSGSRWSSSGSPNAAVFPCACLGKADEISVAFQQKRNGLGLNVGGRLEPHLGDGLQERGGKPEGVKCVQCRPIQGTKVGHNRLTARTFLSSGPCEQDGERRFQRTPNPAMNTAKSRPFRSTHVATLLRPRSNRAKRSSPASLAAVLQWAPTASGKSNKPQSQHVPSTHPWRRTIQAESAASIAAHHHVGQPKPPRQGTQVHPFPHRRLGGALAVAQTLRNDVEFILGRCHSHKVLNLDRVNRMSLTFTNPSPVTSPSQGCSR